MKLSNFLRKKQLELLRKNYEKKNVEEENEKEVYEFLRKMASRSPESDGTQEKEKFISFLSEKSMLVGNKNIPNRITNNDLAGFFSFYTGYFDELIVEYGCDKDLKIIRNVCERHNMNYFSIINCKKCDKMYAYGRECEKYFKEPSEIKKVIVIPKRIRNI